MGAEHATVKCTLRSVIVPPKRWRHSPWEPESCRDFRRGADWFGNLFQEVGRFVFRAVLGEVGLRNDPTTRSFLVNNEHAPNLFVFHNKAWGTPREWSSRMAHR